MQLLTSSSIKNKIKGAASPYIFLVYCIRENFLMTEEDLVNYCDLGCEECLCLKEDGLKKP